MIKQKYLLPSITILTLLTLAGCSSSEVVENSNLDPTSVNVIESASTEPKLVPVKSISHAHGLAVDAADSTKLYIATHNGLLLLKNEKDLFRIGDIQDDFMGFSAHPKNSKTFFTSGHPKQGGNIGIQRSDDGGMTWTKISDGVSGPVDFHSMTLSPANPNILYGWYGALQRSVDEGKNWELITSTLRDVISLTADPHKENILYAATANGFHKSEDKGETWSIFSKELSSGAVTAIAIDPTNDQNILSFSEALGLARSTDSGRSWESIPKDMGIILYFAFDPNTPNTIYALNGDNLIYKSIDGGANWSQIK